MTNGLDLERAANKVEADPPRQERQRVRQRCKKEVLRLKKEERHVKWTAGTGHRRPLIFTRAAQERDAREEMRQESHSQLLLISDKNMPGFALPTCSPEPLSTFGML